METFADVLHAIIDTVFTGDAAAKAHDIIDKASGTRTPQEPEAPVADETAPPADALVPGSEDEASAPPTPGG